jgi:hypothetical protein
MKPIKFPGYNMDFGKPAQWDDQYGDCSTLPVFVDELKVHQSVWKPSLKERVKLLLGQNIVLAFPGFQPPVNVSIQRIAEIKPT